MATYVVSRGMWTLEWNVWKVGSDVPDQIVFSSSNQETAEKEAKRLKKLEWH